MPASGRLPSAWSWLLARCRPQPYENWYVHEGMFFWAGVTFASCFVHDCSAHQRNLAFDRLAALMAVRPPIMTNAGSKTQKSGGSKPNYFWEGYSTNSSIVMSFFVTGEFLTFKPVEGFELRPVEQISFSTLLIRRIP